MNTHDVLAYAIAQEAVRRVASAEAVWSILSPASYVTSSRTWPMPDFVLVDDQKTSMAAEFKPPQQSKREYLTGLGQACAYTKDFDYGLLVIPSFADDGYPIATHIVNVLNQPHFSSVPVGVIEYDPRILSPSKPGFTEVRGFPARGTRPTSIAPLEASFYAKWREMGSHEMSLLLSYSYDEMRRPSSKTGTVRDRAFDKLWNDIQSGMVNHWGGKTRNYSTNSKIGVAKNYRNFLFHIGWTDGTGMLTKDGLDALHAASLYGHSSEPFLDTIAGAVLGHGKHLILFNAISDYQNSPTSAFAEAQWLDGLERNLEERGLLKRNLARHGAATAGSSRQFLKAEKQLWRQLRLIIPRGQRVFHPNRGFIFDWARITDLIQR